MDLTHTNVYYRHPELYDRLGDGHATAELVGELVDAHGPPGASTLLDLGCGTARDLAHLAERFTCTGVDLQPQLLDFARQRRPGLDLRVGDLRTVRLGHPVDVITCLGNSLAYVHDHAGLTQAFATFAAHAHPGTLLILYVSIGITPPMAPITQRSGSFPAQVTVSYTWELRSQVETMHRRWDFDDGHQEHDVIRRRVLFPAELELRLNSSGFVLLEIFDTPDRRGGPLTGPGGYVVARYAENKQNLEG